MWAFQNQTNKIEGQGMTVEIDKKDKKKINIYMAPLPLWIKSAWKNA